MINSGALLGSLLLVVAFSEMKLSQAFFVFVLAESCS